MGAMPIVGVISNVEPCTTRVGIIRLQCTFVFNTRMSVTFDHCWLQTLNLQFQAMVIHKTTTGLRPTETEPMIG